MAIQKDVFTSERMKNLARAAVCGCIETAALAVDANAYDIQMGAAPKAFLADGTYDATLAQTDPIDLSNSAVCDAAGQVIASGLDVALFVLHDGTSATVKLGTERVVKSRANAVSALVSTQDYLTCPDYDMETYICIGYVKFTAAADFTIGTTSLTDSSATYNNVKNMVPGTVVAAV
jgi:hypothetical protein